MVPDVEIKKLRPRRRYVRNQRHHDQRVANDEEHKRRADGTFREGQRDDLHDCGEDAAQRLSAHNRRHVLGRKLSADAEQPARQNRRRNVHHDDRADGDVEEGVLPLVRVDLDQRRVERKHNQNNDD